MTEGRVIPVSGVLTLVATSLNAYLESYWWKCGPNTRAT